MVNAIGVAARYVVAGTTGSGPVNFIGAIVMFYVLPAVADVAEGNDPQFRKFQFHTRNGMKLCQFGDGPLPPDVEKMMQIQDGNPPSSRAMDMFREEHSRGWAQGLRSLYQAVADEPIPSDFADLLARLERRSARGSSH